MTHLIYGDCVSPLYSSLIGVMGRYIHIIMLGNRVLSCDRLLMCSVNYITDGGKKRRDGREKQNNDNKRQKMDGN